MGKPGSIQKPWEGENKLLKFVEVLSILAISLTIMVPILIQRLSTTPKFDVPICLPGQAPFVVELHKGSFVDVLPDGEASCGHTLRVCAEDFQNSSLEMLADASDAQVYQGLVDDGISTGKATRIFVGNDLVSKESYLFKGFTGDFQQMSEHTLISGCGIERNIKKRPVVFQIETVEIIR